MANSELIISTQIFTSSPNGGEAIKPIYKSHNLLICALKGYSMFVEATIIGSENPVVISNINVVNDQGFILNLSNLTEIDNNSYIGFFDLPSEEFQLQVNGKDDNGFPFSYISDISVEPTTISLGFGK